MDEAAERSELEVRSNPLVRFKMWSRVWPNCKGPEPKAPEKAWTPTHIGDVTNKIGVEPSLQVVGKRAVQHGSIGRKRANRSQEDIEDAHRANGEPFVPRWEVGGHGATTGRSTRQTGIGGPHEEGDHDGHVPRMKPEAPDAEFSTASHVSEGQKCHLKLSGMNASQVCAQGG